MNKFDSALVAAPSQLSEEQLVAFFARARTLIQECGPDKNGQAFAVICASIAEGIDTRPQIVGVLKKLGFDYRHANIMLDGGTKSSRHAVGWWLDGATGRYHLLD